MHLVNCDAIYYDKEVYGGEGLVKNQEFSFGYIRFVRFSPYPVGAVE